MRSLFRLPLFAVSVGCGEKSSSEGSESASEYSLPLGAAEIKRLLEGAVELDSLRVRGDLYYQANKWKPYSGWVKETYDSGRVKASGVEGTVVRDPLEARPF